MDTYRKWYDIPEDWKKTVLRDVFVSQEASFPVIQTLRRMRTRAEQRFIAEATAPGARVLRAERFLRKVNICPVFHIK